MPDPFHSIRRLIQKPADAVRWASVLEVTAPKVGNVYPGRPFKDLTFFDFVVAADIAAKHFNSESKRMSKRIYKAVEETNGLTQTNVNLGILLLLGPLVAADELMTRLERKQRNAKDWLSAINIVLESLDGQDGQNIFRAIQIAGAGGLGEVDSMDIAAVYGEVDVLEAMRLSMDRDRVAKQYATEFVDLFEEVLPIVWHSINQSGDLLNGIAMAHLQLLRDQTDSLIARKNGIEAAFAVRLRAAEVDAEDAASIQNFDDYLRDPSHRLNPGTTADLIAASLYILLRTPNL
ncbi:triphosphoribosyl-dephospho-CoA synthase [Rubripirellula sp.]|nr:triphosphoribosyl-dephospho-CoA synthase [Rubripirellula sp.]